MGRDKAKKFSPSYGAEMEKDKTMQDKDEDLILQTHPSLLPICHHPYRGFLVD